MFTFLLIKLTTSSIRILETAILENLFFHTSFWTLKATRVCLSYLNIWLIIATFN